MFVTKPEFRHPLPSALKQSPDCSYWVAMLLSTESQWFLVTFRMGPDKVIQTLAVCWESELVTVLQGLGCDAVVGLSRLCSPAEGRWTVQEVEEVWMAPEDDVDSGDSVVLRFRGDARLKNLFMDPVSQSLSGWTCLVKT